jgi:hypothetical protein
MKNTTIIILATATVATLFGACKKNGIGGDAEIHAKVAHHTQAINASTVYVKFNATELPENPTTNYDLKVAGEVTDNHVHIEELRPGNYYLYAVGFDSTINQTVRGGTGVVIKWSDRKETIEADIAVTE